MRSNLPPIMISGPDQPHALDNVPVRARPDHGDVVCSHCQGRGAWNEMLHLDSFRCRLAICGECDGHGWKASDGSRTVSDIAIRDGLPAWTTRRIPPPPILTVVRIEMDETAPLELEAA